MSCVCEALGGPAEAQVAPVREIVVLAEAQVASVREIAVFAEARAQKTPKLAKLPLECKLVNYSQNSVELLQIDNVEWNISNERLQSSEN